MAYGYKLLLLWFNISGLCVSSVLLVRVFHLFSGKTPLVMTPRSITIAFSMRYSRMLEESSFANKKADYFWLLLQSSVMLLVYYPIIPTVPGYYN